MKIINKNIEEILNNNELNSKFLFIKNHDFNLNCNILTDSFFLDSNNYFPVTDEYETFFDVFKWGDQNKYKNFYTKNFLKNFEINKNQFKNLSDIFILGSHPFNNYYRNLLTFLPRIFFLKEKKIKLAIHRNSSNILRTFILKICDEMNIKVQFIFLDDGFYKFVDSKIPQFFSKHESVNILSKLRIESNKKKEKIFISRQNCSFRNLINESDIFAKLKNHGFKIIDLNGMEIFKQIELFSNAEIIVGSTGSGLANIVFCGSGTKIVEIKPKYNFEYENNLKNRYKNICEQLNLNYFFIEADPIDIKYFERQIQEFIVPQVLDESNYYKDLLLKLDNIEEIIQI